MGTLILISSVAARLSRVAEVKPMTAAMGGLFLGDDHGRLRCNKKEILAVGSQYLNRSMGAWQISSTKCWEGAGHDGGGGWIATLGRRG